MIRFSCPACTQHIAAAHAGAKIRCPSCGQRLQVPELSSPSPVSRQSSPRFADGPLPPPEPDRTWRYAVLAVFGVVGLKVIVPLLLIVALILIFCIRLSLMR